MVRNSPSARHAEPRRTPSQARSRALVDDLLEAAARVFDARGYDATTTNEVAEVAGVSVGSLYQYFPNKDALLAALASRHLEEAAPLVLDLASRLRDEPADAERLCRALVTTAAALNPSARLHELLWHAPRTAAQLETVAAFRSTVVAEVARHLRRLGHPAEAADDRAALLVEVVDVGVHTAQPGRVDRRTEELIRLCLPYVRPDRG